MATSPSRHFERREDLGEEIGQVQMNCMSVLVLQENGNPGGPAKHRLKPAENSLMIKQIHKFHSTEKLDSINNNKGKYSCESDILA